MELPKRMYLRMASKRLGGLVAVRELRRPVPPGSEHVASASSLEEGSLLTARKAVIREASRFR